MKTVERAVPGEAPWAELSAAHLSRYLVAAEHAGGRRVLDAACGAGYGASLLAAAGARQLLAVDIDPAAIATASQNFSSPAIQWLAGDCQRLDNVCGPFDLICCFEAIEHLEHPQRFLRRAGQLLAGDGVLLVSSPERAATPPFVAGRPRNPFHFHEWYRAEFEALLATHFAEVEMRVQVESVALQSRLGAVKALREGLMWTNPLTTLFWRKWPLGRKDERSWKKLAGLAAPSIADYPIVPVAMAPVYGTCCFNFAICRRPLACDKE